MLMKPQDTATKTVLVGLESAGKTTLFSRLTGDSVGEETNVKGSTYSIRSHHLKGRTNDIVVDTPGIRPQESMSYQSIKAELTKASHIVFVIRATHFQAELRELMPLLKESRLPFLIMVTFRDKIRTECLQRLKKARKHYNLPLVVLDGRQLDSTIYDVMDNMLSDGRVLTKEMEHRLLSIRVDEVNPADLLFDRPVVGVLLSILSLFLLFTLPVILAYLFAGWLQPLVDRFLLDPLIETMRNIHPALKSVLIGDYGLFTLGSYSFIWAFPVVLFIGISVALTDESGLKDRMTDALDKPMRKIGLNGQDLIPFLTGFGCNVVAVHQSRLCSPCTRKQCISFISFGSACSYQIGATLSLFNSAQQPWLFLPYLFLLTVVGAVHTRIWHPNRALSKQLMFKPRRTFIQAPTWRGTMYRVRAVIHQFLTQAMPIFLLICLVASLLDYLQIISKVTLLFGPLLSWLNLPAETASGLVFSMVRKDGMLLFNESNGVFLANLPVGSLFLVVYLASTLSACLVTIWTIKKELGMHTALSMAGKQLVTSIASTYVVFLIIH
jgi:ferrous iron transport protein B